MKVLDDVRIHEVPSYPDKQGLLVAYHGVADFGMNIERVFVVTGRANTMRGKHAHKALTQILVCVQGACRVICDDARERREYVLDEANRALIVPNGIWAEQFYVDDGTLLVVLCDLPFDESDYIRNYDDYLTYRRAGAA